MEEQEIYPTHNEGPDVAGDESSGPGRDLRVTGSFSNERLSVNSGYDEHSLNGRSQLDHSPQEQSSDLHSKPPLRESFRLPQQVEISNSAQSDIKLTQRDATGSRHEYHSLAVSKRGFGQLPDYERFPGVGFPEIRGGSGRPPSFDKETSESSNSKEIGRRERWVTVEEAAEELGLSISTIYQHVHRRNVKAEKRIVPVTIEKEMLFVSVDELEEHLQEYRRFAPKKYHKGA